MCIPANRVEYSEPAGEILQKRHSSQVVLTAASEMQMNPKNFQEIYINPYTFHQKK